MADPNEVGGWVIDPNNPNRATYTDADGQVYESFNEDPQAAPTAEPVQRGGWDRFVDSFKAAGQEGFAGQISQKWYDWTDAKKPELRKAFPGQSEEWYEEQSDKIVSEARRRVIEEVEKRQTDDPTWSPDESFLENVGAIDRWGPYLAGAVLGSAGPESLVNPGGTALARIGSQAGLGGLTDAIYQGLNIFEDVKDEYSLQQSLGAAAAAAGLQGTFEIPGFVKSLFKGSGAEATTPRADPRAPTSPDADPTLVAYQSKIKEMLDNGASADEIRQFVASEGADPNAITNLDAAVQARDAAREISVVVQGEGDPLSDRLAAEANAFLNREEAPIEVSAPREPSVMEEGNLASQAPAKPLDEQLVTVRAKKAEKQINDAITKINDLIGDWENAPKIEVIDDIKNLADKELAASIDPDAIGVYLPDGRVVINLKNVDSPETLSAVTFHESLGHHGLTQRFGDDLDGMLVGFYEDAKGSFRQKVDKWLEENPDDYTGPDRIARASEEVLAQMSEAGRITPTILNQFRNWIKEWGRAMGLDLRYSDREIATILGMAHDATIKGVPDRSARLNGFRYNRPANDNRSIAPTIPSGSSDKEWADYYRKLAKHYRAKAAKYESEGKTAHAANMRHRAALEDNSARRRDPDSPDPTPAEQAKLYRDQVAYYQQKMDERFAKGDAEGVERHRLFRDSAREKAAAWAQESLKSTKYKKTRRDQIKDATAALSDTQPGTTKTVQPFESEEPNYWRFRHVTEDGKAVTGTYDIEDGKLTNFSINSEGGARSIGPKAIRQIGRQLLEQHPEASRISGFRISGARPEERFAESGNRFMKKRPEGQEENVGAVNPNKIRTVADVDDYLYELQAVNPNRKTTWEETEAEALARGLTPSRIAKRRGAQGLSSYLRAGNIALAQQLENVAKLEARMSTEGYSEALHEQTLAAMNMLRLVHARVNYDNSEVGRALNILRRTSETKEFSRRVLEEMEKAGSDLANPEQFMKYMKLVKAHLEMGNDAAAIKLTRDIFKPGAGDYAFSLWYNMMLSSPATHVANFAGTGGHFLSDLLANTGAAVTGQFKRSNLDRVRFREIGYRVYGALQGFRAAETWENARKSLSTGLTGNQPNVKAGEDGAHNLVIGDAFANASEALGVGRGVGQAVGAFIEAPTRALAGTDEWWRNILQLSNIYGLAVRNAGNKGLKGKAFWDEVKTLTANPTKEMLEATSDYTKTLQFLDKPSKLASGLMRLQHADRDASIGSKAAAGMLKMTVPFVRTPDSLIRSTLRWTPLGAFERENLRGWKAGGAERDKVKARLIMGSMISFGVAVKAANGEITGEGPSDYRKNAAWRATHQPNSIKVGDTYYSIEGLEPVSTLLTGIATLVERGEAGELAGDEYGKQALALAQGIGAVLTQNSYMDNLNNAVSALYGGEGQAESAITNWAAGLASSVTTPAIVRKYAQGVDPAVRDTTGSGSLSDRLEGRIASGVPGLTEGLPQRYDVYGRPETRDIAGPDTASRVRMKEESDDPVIQELSRLEEVTDKVLIGPPGKSNIKVNGEARRLTAEEFQQYQGLSGYWIVEYMRQEMETPEWQDMSDTERLDHVKEIRDEIRKVAREYLFETGETEEDEEGDIEDE